MPVAKALDTGPALNRARAGHVLCHPQKLQVAQVAEPAQLHRGLQMQAPGGQVSLQGLEPGWEEKRSGDQEEQGLRACEAHREPWLVRGRQLLAQPLLP